MNSVDSWVPPARGLELNLGCGRHPEPGWTNVDRAEGPGVDCAVDLEDAKLPFGDDSVSKIRMIHVFEHINNALGLMEELHRIAKGNAVLLMKLPFGGSDSAWEDPTHVRPYFIHSFGFFSQPYYHRADYGYRGDWQPVQIELVVDSELDGTPAEELVRQVYALRNVVKEMTVVMRCVKPIREQTAEQEYPSIKFCYQ